MFKRIAIGLLISLTLIISLTSTARSNEDSDLEVQLNETKSQLESANTTKQATQTELERLEALKSQYENMLQGFQNNYSVTQSQLHVTQGSIQQKEAEITDVENELLNIEQDLNRRQANIQQSIRTLYINQHIHPFTTIMDSSEANLLSQLTLYRESVINGLRDEIIDLNAQIRKVTEIKNLLTEIKAQLQEEKTNLINQQRYLQNEISSTQGNISTTQSQQQDLQQALLGIDSQINELTQRQKDILAAKAAAALASTTVGDIEITASAIEQDPPQDGQVYFSFWTYGYPHRVGMSQYGALGRAMAGQSAEEILKAYYSGVAIETRDSLSNIKLTDGREINFEDEYLMGIGEMPSCWGKPDRGGLESLKAQAIAARTYALAYTNNGAGSICTNQHCQVYVGESKVRGVCGEYWQQAVEETRGQIITYDGQPIKAWYASTAGGFTLSSAEVWGGNRPYVQGIADLDSNGQPYEGPDYAGSPWYYKAWGNEPWLSFDQVTSLINAALLPDSYNNQLSDLEPDQVKTILTENGIEPVTNLSAIEIIDENGNPGSGTAQVAHVRAYFDSDKMVSVTGSRFKFVYNLRSPGTNAIWTTRFNVVTAAKL